MRIKAFITHKKAEKSSDCQDRFAVNEETMTAAVSDGVSQSIFPDLWANLLVEHYTRSGQLSEQDRLDLCQKWKNLVLKYIDDEKAKGNNPWRTESNLTEGISAGATLCGIKFDDKAHWTCDVLGDSCLIIVEKDSTKIISSEEKAFDTYPDYLDSNPSKKGRGVFRRIEGELSDKNKLILVSDPFSDFFYKLKDNSRKYIDELLSTNNHDDFVVLVEKWRDEGMHNDDSTVVIIEWDDSMAFNFDCVDNLVELIKSEEQDEGDRQKTNEPELSLYKELSEKHETPPSENERSDSKSDDKKENSPSSSNNYISRNEETKTSESQSESVNSIEGNKDSDKNEIEKMRERMLDQIPSFIEEFASEEELKKHAGFTNIIRFVFNGKRKRYEELKNFIEYILNNYVKFFK